MEDLETPEAKKSAADENNRYGDNSIRTYLKDIGRFSMLERWDEYDLGMCLKEARNNVAELKKQIRETEDPEEKKELKVKLASEMAVFNKIVNLLTTANLRLVVHVAKRFRGKGMNFQDLIQEGNMGLRHAVTKYDAERARLSVYAGWWIRQHIARALADRGRTIRLPVGIRELVNKTLEFQKVFENLNGRPPVPEEIAEGMELKPEKVAKILKYMQIRDLETDSPVGDDDSFLYGNFLRDETTVDPVEEILLNQKKEIVDGMLDKLNPNQRKVMLHRYGRTDNYRDLEGVTLEHVGERMNLTKERIRQIQVQAEEKLRKMMQHSDIKEEL